MSGVDLVAEQTRTWLRFAMVFCPAVAVMLAMACDNSLEEASLRCVEGNAIPSRTTQPSAVSDCVVLLQARDVLAGSAQLNWAADTSLDDWRGVTMEETRVLALDLTDRQLNGRIPQGLSNLSNLRTLNFSGNDLSGEIPPELGNLSNLNLLDLSDNGLSGEIPPELGNLSKLRSLSLANNELSGEMPSELGDLPYLRSLSLSGNPLKGEIPLKAQCRVAGAVITGPDTLGLTADCAILLASRDALAGRTTLNWSAETPIYEWDGVTIDRVGSGVLIGERRITRLDLSDRQLTGMIPPELGKLSGLTMLFLNNNQLSGAIPPESGSLSSLTRLSVNNNQLSGEIPPELDNLTSLRWLHLSDNQLEPIPSELGNLWEAMCITGGAVPLWADSSNLVSDCAALLACRDTMVGSATFNWSADTSVDNWESVTVVEKRIVQVEPLGTLGQCWPLPTIATPLPTPRQSLSSKATAASKATPSLSENALTLLGLYKELQRFRYSSEFHFYCYAVSGPYHRWSNRVNGLPARDIYFETQVTPQDLFELGWAYCQNQGSVGSDTFDVDTERKLDRLLSMIE